MGYLMSFSILLSLTAQLMSVSTECAAALLSFRYPRSTLVTVSINYKYVFYLKRLQLTQRFRRRPTGIIGQSRNKSVDLISFEQLFAFI